MMQTRVRNRWRETGILIGEKYSIAEVKKLQTLPCVAEEKS
jgi:hypothetical protein